MKESRFPQGILYLLGSNLLVGVGLDLNLLAAAASKKPGARLDLATKAIDELNAELSAYRCLRDGLVGLITTVGEGIRVKHAEGFAHSAVIVNSDHSGINTIQGAHKANTFTLVHKGLTLLHGGLLVTVHDNNELVTLVLGLLQVLYMTVVHGVKVPRADNDALRHLARWEEV